MKVYDEMCAWPYHEPYGMVAAPKVKKPKKPRKSRAMPAWLKEQRKLERRASSASRTQPGITFVDELGQAKSRVKRIAMKHLLKEVTNG